MSFRCHATLDQVGEPMVVRGQKMVLVPLETRKVKYIGTITKKSFNKEEEPRVIFTGDSEGWEVVREVPVCHDKAAEFIEQNPPKVVCTKEVRVYRPMKKDPKDSGERSFYRRFEHLGEMITDE